MKCLDVSLKTQKFGAKFNKNCQEYAKNEGKKNVKCDFLVSVGSHAKHLAGLVIIILMVN